MQTLAVVVLAVVSVCMGMRMPGPVRLAGPHSLGHSFTPRREVLRDSHNTMLGHIIQEFGLDLSVELQKPNNVVISPLSVSALLSVLMMGSARQSYRELRRALRIPDTMDEKEIHLAFERLMDTISTNDSDVTLNVANALFIQRGANIIYDFTQKAHKHYNSLASTLDFQNSHINATETINKWVNVSTNGMIPNLYKQPLSPRTTFVAVNTVFFNGKWSQPFDPLRTTNLDFDTGTGKIKVPMMSGEINIKYINIPELDAHMAAIPYKGGKQYMYIILPRGPVVGSLDSLEQELSSERLNAFIANMNNVEMRLWLPRMRLSFKASLKDTLINLHVGSIFNPVTANFSRLTSQPVWVDDIVHETVVEVTEEGTKAAAATASDLHRVGSSRTFIVNRPAIFFILDEDTRVPLFWGKLVRPKALRQAVVPRKMS